MSFQYFYSQLIAANISLSSNLNTKVIILILSLLVKSTTSIVFIQLIPPFGEISAFLGHHCTEFSTLADHPLRARPSPTRVIWRDTKLEIKGNKATHNTPLLSPPPSTTPVTKTFSSTLTLPIAQLSGPHLQTNLSFPSAQDRLHKHRIHKDFYNCLITYYISASVPAHSKLVTEPSPTTPMPTDKSNRFTALREDDEEEEVAETMTDGWDEELSVSSDHSEMEKSLSSTNYKVHKRRSKEAHNYQGVTTSLVLAAASIGFPYSKLTKLQNPISLGRGGGLSKVSRTQEVPGGLLFNTGMDSDIPVRKS